MSMADDFEGPMIRVQDLVTHYGERRILNNVSLDFPRGETMVILGEAARAKARCCGISCAWKCPLPGGF